jgi:tRNA threonylcarbamoyl adenosine modification protein (Sua5/YciO/YrdC/YwlC family)
MLIEIHPKDPPPRQINRVVDCLKKGGVIIYPTDTIYGMGCDIFQFDAIMRICSIKGVDPKKAQFSFICRDLSHITDYAKNIDNTTFRLLKSHLPGPFTFILEAGKLIPKVLQNKKSTIGIRVPDNRICMDLLEALGNPIISTTLPGEMVEEYTDPLIIHENFGNRVDMVIDAGIGGMIPSTVVDLSQGEPIVLREGAGVLQ